MQLSLLPSIDLANQVDLVACEDAPNGRRRVLAVGEVKSPAAAVGEDQLDRLDHICTAPILAGEAGHAQR